jgi:tetratricopeptide (TPR) repeat protein
MLNEMNRVSNRKTVYTSISARSLALSLTLLSLSSTVSPVLAQVESATVTTTTTSTSTNASTSTSTSPAPASTTPIIITGPDSAVIPAVVPAAESLTVVKTRDVKTGATTSAVTTRVVKRADANDVANQSLDPISLHMVNVGDWSGLIDRLNKLLGSEPARGDAGQLRRSYRQGWLAFAYMFNAKPEQSQALSDQVDRDRVALADIKNDVQRKLYGNALIVRAFNQIAQGKNDAAENTLLSVPETNRADALYNFAFAAVCGKKGQATRAIDYSLKTIDADPRLAWAYRTIGFLRLRWLKDTVGAEQALLEAIKLEPSSGEARDMLIDIKLGRNDFDGAIQWAKEGIIIDPKSGANHFRLAQIYIQQWRLNEALEQLNLAIADDASNAKYFRNRASVKKLKGDIDAAIADQQVAVQLGKDKAFELTELANMNVIAGNMSKAVENFKQALAVDPENPAARERLFKILLQEKRYDDVAAQYQQQIERNPKKADLRLGYANVLLMLNQSDKAVEEFKEAANLSQTDPTPHRSLGAYYITRKEFAKAAKEYTRALNIQPTSVKDLVALGFCYAENDDYIQAEAAFVTALALQQLSPNAAPDEPSRLDVMRSLACLLYDEGRYADAAAQFENLIAVYHDKGATKDDSLLLAKSKMMRDLNAASAKVLNNALENLSEERRLAFRYSVIEALLDANRFTEARAQLDKIPAEERKDNLSYALYDATALRLSGNFKGSLDIASQAVPLAESSKADSPAIASRLLCEKARAELALGKTDEASASAKAALALYEKCYPAYLCLAQIAIAKNDHVAAMEAGRKALELNPYYAPAYLVQGEAQFMSGAGKAALESYKKAAELYPGWIEAHKALLSGYQKLQLTQDAQREAAQIAQMEGMARGVHP